MKEKIDFVRSMMSTANSEFGFLYDERCDMNPDWIFKKGHKFYTVIMVYTRSVSYKNAEGVKQPEKSPYSGVEGSIEFLTRKGKKRWINFICHTHPDDVKCTPDGNYGRNEYLFAQLFVEFFLYEFLSVRNISIEKWIELTTPVVL